MKKKLYLMRHGETQNNVDEICQGRGDSALTKRGIKQLESVREDWLPFHEIDHFYSSPIGRARRSLGILTEHPYEVLEGLTERNQGDREGKKFVDLSGIEDYAVKYHGELKGDSRKRIMKVMAELMEKENRNVLAMSHGAVCSHFRNIVIGKEAGSWIDNGSIFEYEWEDGQFTYIKEYRVSEIK